MRFLKKNWFNYLVILSFVFLAVSLYRAEYLVILATNNIFISYADAIRSVGLAIFTKYIPGKVLLILGKAEYIANAYQQERKVTSAISLQTQLITLWVGYTLGCIGLYMLGGFSTYKWSYLAVLLWLILSLLVFLPLVKVTTEKMIAWLFKKKINIPTLSFRQVFASLPAFIGNWLAWSLSFYFLCDALSEAGNIPLVTGLAFSLAGTIGIMAIIAPGGLGVREATLTFYLSLVGLNLVEATTIGIASRLWFLIGEFFIFLLAFLLQRFKRLS